MTRLEFDRYGKVVAGLLAVVAVLWGSMGGVASAQTAPPVRGDVRLVNAIIASIDGKPVTLREFAAYRNGRGRLLPTEQQRTDSTFLDGMIEERMLEAEFRAQDISADDEDTQYYIDRVLAMNGSTRADVERALAEIRLSWSDYFERMRFEVQKLALINREIRARVHVTDEEVERYWKESGGSLEPEGVEVSQIFVPLPLDGNRAQVELAVERAKAAATAIDTDGFERAAKTYSFGPTADEGGSLGTFEQGQLAPEFERQLARLEVGDHTEVFEASGGLHILRLDRVIASGDRKDLTDERREQIRNRLYDDMLDVRLQRWLREDLRKKHHVNLRLDRIGKLVGARSAAKAPTPS